MQFTNYRFDKNILLINRFEHTIKDNILLVVSVVTFSFILPFDYCIFSISTEPQLFISFLSDYFFFTNAVIIFPLHCLIIKQLWAELGELICSVRLNSNKFRIKLKKIDNIIISDNKQKLLESTLFRIFLSIMSIALAFLFLHSRNLDYWWGDFKDSIIGGIFYILSISFIFYQLFCHNLLGIKAVLILNRFLKLNPYVNFWQVHNNYLLPNFNNIFVLIILSSMLHVLSIYSIYYFNYFRTAEFFYIVFIIFLVFAPLFWWYPLYSLHKFLKKKKNKALDKLAHKIEKNDIFNSSFMIKYEILSKRRTLLTDLPIKGLSLVYLFIQIAGVLFSAMGIYKNS